MLQDRAFALESAAADLQRQIQDDEESSNAAAQQRDSLESQNRQLSFQLEAALQTSAAQAGQLQVPPFRAKD